MQGTCKNIPGYYTPKRVIRFIIQLALEICVSFGTLRKSSINLRKCLGKLGLSSEVFGNLWDNIGNLRVDFGKLRKSSSNLRKYPDRLRLSSEVFGVFLRVSFGNLRTFRLSFEDFQ